MKNNGTKRVCITGMGAISPFGNSIDQLWAGLSGSRSCVTRLERVPSQYMTTDVGGIASEFTGAIGDFGPLEKLLQRNVKKGLKLMCREIQMGVAAAQLAISHAALTEAYPPERIGTMFGSDYIISEPAEFSAGMGLCTENGRFDFSRWGESGLKQVEPLWLLKYLPNMPASHVAIYNDFRGPSNSITLREASSNLSVAESVTTIRRGAADAILAGSTGSRVHPLRTLHCSMQEQLAEKGQEPEKACRPFDAGRTGMVIGEGAGVLILEEMECALARGATIHGEVVGYGSSTVANAAGVADYAQAFKNVIRMALSTSGMKPEEIGHVHAHGLSSVHCDAQEAVALREMLGDVPVVAAKSGMGNLGAGSGMVEMVASILALANRKLFPVLNQDQSDPECPVNVVTKLTDYDGDSFLNLNISPQGQASSILIRRFS